MAVVINDGFGGITVVPTYQELREQLTAANERLARLEKALADFTDDYSHYAEVYIRVGDLRMRVRETKTAFDRIINKETLLEYMFRRAIVAISKAMRDAALSDSDHPAST